MSTTFDGSTPSGTRYRIEVPPSWNDVLLLYSRGVPVGPDDPPWDEGEPLFAALLEEGYAVAGSGGPIFWPLEDSFRNQDALLDEFARRVGDARRTIAVGYSIGGIITAGLVQVLPDRLSGALPMCGNLAGAVGVHNRELDIAFVLRTLLAPDSALELVRIGDPGTNLRLAEAMLTEAVTTAEGQARLALAAAVGNIPGWHDPLAAEPAPEDFAARLANQVSWYEEPGLLVYFFLRAQVESQAGGNPSWNSGVDYGELLRRSIARDEVEGLYAEAGVDLRADLELLAATPRIEADPDAVRYLERNIVFSGDLGGVPVLTLHTDGDGLVTPDNEHAYADVVAAAGQEELLRQLHVHRGGHCTFTVAETLVALGVLRERIENGGWPSVDPDGLNVAATGLGPARNLLARSGEPAQPAFFAWEPWPFSRPHDIRNAV
ncbi:MAG: hypothetical protein MSC30_08880 [Gaiellaceae bacterium MAG52_C11]|nr:hypothetical protein [Candidatus Gaiellasilicea maunaloa]